MRYTIVVEYLTTKGRTRCEEIECDFDLMDEENNNVDIPVTE